MNRFLDQLPEYDERADGRCECQECKTLHPPDDMAHLNNRYFCAACLEPKQPAFDAVVSMVEHMESEIKGLTAELNQIRRHAA